MNRFPAASLACLLAGCAATPPAGTIEGDRCGLDLDGWARGELASPAPMPVLNRLSVDSGGGFAWNGQAIDRETARRYLQITAAMAPRPLLLLEADSAAPCDAVGQAVAIADSVLGCTPRQCRFAWTADR